MGPNLSRTASEGIQMAFDLLPSGADYVEIARICRLCMQNLHEHERLSYPRIAELINRYRGDYHQVAQTALKTFVLRGESSRVNANNKTLAAIYNYLVGQMPDLPAEVADIIRMNWGTLSPSDMSDASNEQNLNRALCQATAKLFCQWLKSSESDLSKLRLKLGGKYVLIRKSVTDQDLLVKSDLIIDASSDREVIKARHIHVDRTGVSRVSEGFVVPVVSNIYCILDVEDGQGLEIIALKEPIQQKWQRMYGFCWSMNFNRMIISAQVFLERDSEHSNDAPSRMRLSDPTSHPYVAYILDQRLHKQIDEGPCATIPDLDMDDKVSREGPGPREEVPMHSP
jgi:hypothetical protein